MAGWTCPDRYWNIWEGGLEADEFKTDGTITAGSLSSTNATITNLVVDHIGENTSSHTITFDDTITTKDIYPAVTNTYSLGKLDGITRTAYTMCFLTQGIDFGYDPPVPFQLVRQGTGINGYLFLNTRSFRSALNIVADQYFFCKRLTGGRIPFTVSSAFDGADAAYINDSANLTFNSSTNLLSVPNLTISTALKNTALTSGRVVFTTTGGQLTDDADLTFSGNTLFATKACINYTSIPSDTALRVKISTNNNILFQNADSAATLAAVNDANSENTPINFRASTIRFDSVPSSGGSFKYVFGDGTYEPFLIDESGIYISALPEDPIELKSGPGNDSGDTGGTGGSAGVVNIYGSNGGAGGSGDSEVVGGDGGAGGDVTIAAGTGGAAGGDGGAGPGNDGAAGFIKLASDTLFVTDGGGLPYGSCYGNEIGWSQAAAQNTWYEVSDADMADGQLNLFTHDGNGQLTALKAGKYLINYGISLEISVAGKHIESGISISGTEQNDGRAHFEAQTANSQVHLSSTAILNLAENATIEISVRTTDSGNPTIAVDHLNITAVQIGG